MRELTEAVELPEAERGGCSSPSNCWVAVDSWAGRMRKKVTLLKVHGKRAKVRFEEKCYKNQPGDERWIPFESLRW